MKSAQPKKPASAKSTQSSKIKETKLYLVQPEAKPVAQVESKSRAGDMDMLERAAEKPMPAFFEQVDRTCKAAHSFIGWPYPIV
jgi:hypothetical protein